ncbi:Ubiquitin carboxyl-terminal hydrolase [Fasciolopsis buskii]|uniref:Ubiquitin carboxyl-terminal hydrolase n=1 Tax=Fasciolopsis buskii TaxID=27845 RepID=A0A8E0RPM5_9TREM|nr:Ubiquitin carboxyl-terminal hydrolase [Fasciolopsis buski]
MRWLPLEANPDVLNKYLEKLGVKGPWKFHDILGLDEQNLNTITGQVAAVLLVFPKSEAELEKKLGQETADETVTVIKQTVDQACGSVAILHALINCNELIPVEPGSVLDTFVSKIKKMTPAERGHAMEHEKDLFNLHETMAKEGQSKTPARESETNQLYVCFIHHKGHLYELDGRRALPVTHGNTTDGTLLQDTAKVIKKFVERDSNKVNFSMLVLSS